MYWNNSLTTFDLFYAAHNLQIICTILEKINNHKNNKPTNIKYLSIQLMPGYFEHLFTVQFTKL